LDTVTILRRLWRAKFLVAAVALLAVVVGIAVGFRYSPPLKLESRKYTVGVGTARILVDTPESQVVDVAPKGSDSTGARANLISTLMVDGEIKTLIAKRAGLDPSKLIGTSQANSDPAAAAAKPTRDSYVLSTQVTTISNGTWLPIIEIDVQAPDVAGARKLADAAVAGLREYLDTKAAAEAVPDANRLRVSGLGVAQARLTTRGPRLLFSLAAMIFVFVGGCAAILMIGNIVRGLRTPEAPEPPAREPEPEPEPQLPPEPVQAAPSVDEWGLDGPDAAWPRAARPEAPIVPAADFAEPEDEPADLPKDAPKHPVGRVTSWWGGDPR